MARGNTAFTRYTDNENDERARINFIIDDKEVKKALVTLEKRADAVIARAANRTLTTANKRMSKEVRERYPAVKDEYVRKALFKKRASANHPTAALKYRSRHENVYKMGFVSPRRIVRGNSPALYKARVMAGQPLKPLERRPRPFVQRMPENGHVGLFVRTGNDPNEINRFGRKRKRNEIRAVLAPALTQMMANQEVLNNVNEEAGEAFLKRLDHEIAWELRK